MGGGLPICGISAGGAPSAMNLIGAMSEMSLNGGNMGPVMFFIQSAVQPQQATTSPPAPPPASGTDPFTDLGGLF